MEKPRRKILINLTILVFLTKSLISVEMTLISKTMIHPKTNQRSLKFWERKQPKEIRIFRELKAGQKIKPSLYLQLRMEKEHKKNFMKVELHKFLINRWIGNLETWKFQNKLSKISRLIARQRLNLKILMEIN